MQAETFLFRRAAGRKLRRWVRPTRKARMSRFDKSKLQAMFGGKGFYIALAVCLLAAGTIGYITLFSSDSPVKEPDPVIEIKPAPVTPVPVDELFNPWIQKKYNLRQIRNKNII